MPRNSALKQYKAVCFKRSMRKTALLTPFVPSICRGIPIRAGNGVTGKASSRRDYCGRQAGKKGRPSDIKGIPKGCLRLKGGGVPRCCAFQRPSCQIAFCRIHAALAADTFGVKELKIGSLIPVIFSKRATS